MTGGGIEISPRAAVGSAVAAPSAAAHLLRGVYSLLANTAITSGLGMVFWVTAARLFPSTTVGRDTVLISVMIELSAICQLNMGNGITKFLPGLGVQSARALLSVYGAVSLVALLIGATFVLIAPNVSQELAFLGHDALLPMVFVVALVLWGVFTLQDAALTALRRAPWVPLENGVFGVLKLAALPLALLAAGSNGVFVAWVVPMALMVLPVNWLMFRRVIPAAANAADGVSALARTGRRRAVAFLTQDYAASVFTQATLTTLPLLVIALLGARQSAYFAMPFTIAVAFDTFAYGACAPVVAEASLRPELIPSFARVYARKVWVPLIPVAVGMIVAAPLVLALFGPAYASHGTGALRLLLVASIVRMALALFSAVSRAQGQGRRLAALEFTLLVVALGMAVPLADADGIEGVAAAWLAANLVAGLATAPVLIRVLRAT